MNAREQALLGYFATISMVSAVRNAKSIIQLRDAVLDCLKEDFKTVGKFALAGLLETKVKPVAKDAVDHVFSWLGGAIANLGSKKR